MKECWAKSLGDCSGDISKEHIISDSILLDVVTVQGLSWCKDIPKKIPSANFTSKILCEKHNNMLSPSDNEIKNFVFTFKAYFENSLAYNMKPARFTEFPIRHSINGDLLEQWFCKTLINVATLNSTDAEIEIDKLLPYLFKNAKFKNPFGLSFVVKTGHSISSQDNSIAVLPLFHIEEGKQKLLIGCRYVFRGFYFIVLIPTRINPITNNTLSLSEEDREWEGMQLNWHNKEITEFKQWHSMKIRFQVVTFHWE